MRTTIRGAAPRAALLLLLAGACSAAPAAGPAQVALPPPPDASVSTPAIAVVAARPPVNAVIDGDVAEWGALPVPQPSVPHPADADDPKNPVPNPPEAPSRLAVAVTGEGLLIAAELGEVARDGIWLGIGARSPGLPALGQPAGRAGFLELQCEFEVTCYEAGGGGEGTVCMPDTQKPNPPEVVAACRRLIARHEELLARHDKRFHKLFRIDREGIRVLGPQGELGAVPGAKHAWKAGAKGATLEVALPLAAMPRVAEAPLEALTLLAQAGAGAAPDVPPARWVRVVLPQAVAFEPHAALRERAFAPQHERDRSPPVPMGMTTYEQPLGMSYQPGDPLRIEAAHAGFEVSEVNLREHTLYERRLILGDVEVGSVDLGDRTERLGIWKAGKLLDLAPLPGSFRGVVVRDGEIHALAHGVPAWSGVAVALDGKHRDVVAKITLRADRKLPSYLASWDDVEDFAGLGFDTFGWRGRRRRTGVEVTWRWDRARRMYTATERSITPPKKAKK